MKPYYESGGITIYLGDCREVLPTLAADSADLVLTDPPDGIHKAGWDMDFPSLAWMEEAGRIAPLCGVMPGVWNIGNMPNSVGNLVYKWCLAIHLINGMTNGAIGFGNWIPVLIYQREESEASAYKADTDCKDIVVGRSEKPDHPSPKPYEAMRWLVSRIPGETVLDPFMGSGTTLRAAKDLGRRAIGIEIEERYAEIAARRLAQEVLL